ncbi:MAG: transposase, partial [Proteobacteria bacterium]|nr:transposase [Pseudomonadota bacterium]
MARDLRIEYNNAFHHVMNRGYHGMQIFYDHQDFNRFLDDLLYTFKSHTLVIHSYCLMHNHFHLLTETPHANLQKAMQRLQTRYASYFKAKYKHRGKVFEKRYKAILVDTDTYALDLARYIHRNPVGPIVQDPASWTYSSYRSYLGYDSKPKFLDTDLVLNRFDQNINAAKIKLQKHMELEESSYWLPDDFIIGKSILGSASFVERIKAKLAIEVNDEITGLIALSSEDKVSVIKAYIARLNFDFKLQLNLMIYAFSTRSQLNRSEINNLLGTN